MPFELTIFQNNRPLAAMMMMLLEQCGFQQQHDDEGLYLFKTYGNSNDVRHELLALAPNIQLDEHLENDSIYCFQHTAVGHIVVEIHPPVQLILCDVWIYPPLQQLLEHRIYAKSTDSSPLRRRMLSDNLWVGEHTRPEQVQESSRISGKLANPCETPALR